MHFTYISALAAASLLSPIAAAPTTATDLAPIPGYSIETLSWSIEVSPGQIQILNGTVQEVVAQAVQLNPDFKLSSTKRAADAGVMARELHKRDVICGNFPTANPKRILEGIAYLNSLPGGDRPTNGPGPGACGRVSCSYNSAIWWCNDNTSPKTLDGWNAIARSAQTVYNGCVVTSSNQVAGQSFEPGSWNTIVRGDSC